VNSIEPGGHDDIVISARHTWAVYDVSLATGRIRWQLGGKGSTLRLGPGTQFAWQHDARFQAGGLLSLFDNGAARARPGISSSGLVLRVDVAGRSTLLVRRLRLGQVLATSQGSVQVLPRGATLVGWGSAPWVSGYDAAGRLVYAARFRAPDETYRAFLLTWHGRPTTPPSLTTAITGAGPVAYASWNGATGVVAWRVLEGSSAGALTVRATVPRGGFMTGIRLPAGPGYVEVRALDASGRVLGVSGAVRF